MRVEIIERAKSLDTILGLVTQAGAFKGSIGSSSWIIITSHQIITLEPLAMKKICKPASAMKIRINSSNHLVRRKHHIKHIKIIKFCINSKRYKIVLKPWAVEDVWIRKCMNIWKVGVWLHCKVQRTRIINKPAEIIMLRYKYKT